MADENSTQTVSDNTKQVSETDSGPSVQPADRIDKWIYSVPLLGKAIKKMFQSKPSVSVIRLEGVLSSGRGAPFGSNTLNIDALGESINEAFEGKRLQAVCLQINSPGGSPTQSYLIAKRIRDLAAEKNVQVISCIEDVAASGGYWLACAGDEIVAVPTSTIGSIGVVASTFGFQDAIKRIGVERRVYAQGKNKVQLDPFQPEKEEDVKMLKTHMQELHELFIQEVKDRRQGKLTNKKVELFDGSFWHAHKALEYGLIDGINDVNCLIKQRFGEDIKINIINKEKGWLKRRLGMMFSVERWINVVVDVLEQRLLFKRYGV